MKVKLKKKRILCPSCKTGQESYLQDKTSPICPYFNCYNGYTCAYYVPIDGSKVKFKGIIRMLLDIFKSH